MHVEPLRIPDATRNQQNSNERDIWKVETWASADIFQKDTIWIKTTKILFYLENTIFKIVNKHTVLPPLTLPAAAIVLKSLTWIMVGFRVEPVCLMTHSASNNLLCFPSDEK
jgi:hypothetical protein